MSQLSFGWNRSPTLMSNGPTIRLAAPIVVRYRTGAASMVHLCLARGFYNVGRAACTTSVGRSAITLGGWHLSFGVCCQIIGRQHDASELILAATRFQRVWSRAAVTRAVPPTRLLGT